MYVLNSSTASIDQLLNIFVTSADITPSQTSCVNFVLLLTLYGCTMQTLSSYYCFNRNMPVTPPVLEE